MRRQHERVDSRAHTTSHPQAARGGGGLRPACGWCGRAPSAWGGAAGLTAMPPAPVADPSGPQRIPCLVAGRGRTTRQARSALQCGSSFVYAPKAMRSGQGERRGVALVYHFSNIIELGRRVRQPRVSRRPRFRGAGGKRLCAGDPVPVKGQSGEAFQNSFILHGDTFDADAEFD